MNFRYEMPTSIYFGRNVIRDNADVFHRAGKKALLVTGQSSAKKNGSLQDIIWSLEKKGVTYVLFDEVEENPSLETIERGATIGSRENADFIIGIGGGSPMDAAKAIAVFIQNPSVTKETIFKQGSLSALPVIAVATTAGTGSEVTPYSIVTVNAEKTKKNLGQRVFPVAAFLDSKYTEALPVDITVNTAVDAFTHLVEGYLNTNSNQMSDLYAEEGFALFASCFPKLLQQQFDASFREAVLYASMLAGMVIAQTGTSLPHGMGYALTYHKGLSHGAANGILTSEYLKIFKNQTKLERMLSLLKLESIQKLEEILKRLMPVKVLITEQEIEAYASAFLANKAKRKNHPEEIGLEEILQIYKNSLLGFRSFSI
ncbi:MAG: hypothetical protein PWP24_99 [Clostridiales bacterium]|nr:hypothetical protein [Clostridiales bacterium]